MRHLLMPSCVFVLSLGAIAQPKADDYKPATFTNNNRLDHVDDLFAAIDKVYADYAARNHFPGVTYGIVLDGQLVHSGSAGALETKSRRAATPQSLFRIASMTKSFTAMAILKLEEQGKLSVRDPAAKYIPEMKSFKYLTADAAPITIYNLLTMTAGFPEDNPWGDRQLQDTEAEFERFLKDGVSFSSNPGQQFEYSNLGYAILGQIVRRVSGVSYQEYITKNILQPLGMTHTLWEYTKADPSVLAIGYRWEDEQWKAEPLLHDGVYGAMGGLITSIEDFSKYVAFHLSAYPYRSTPDQGPVKRSTLREMHRPGLPQLVQLAGANGQPCAAVAGYGFGLGCRVDCRNITRISHSGGLPGFGSQYAFYPDYGVGVISFANLTYANLTSVNQRVLDTLLTAGKLQPRELPVSATLEKRKEQLIKILSTWDEQETKGLFAENFFLDKSRDRWKTLADSLLTHARGIKSVTALTPQNQLRGSFILRCHHGDIDVFFTLTPEADPKIQELHLEYVPLD